MVVGSRMIVAAWLLLARADAYLAIAQGRSTLRVLPWKQSRRCDGLAYEDWKLQFQAPYSDLNDSLNICANACYSESGCVTAEGSTWEWGGRELFSCRTTAKKCPSFRTYDEDYFVMENLSVYWEEHRLCTGKKITDLTSETGNRALKDAQRLCYEACAKEESCKFAVLEHFNHGWSCSSYGDDCTPAIANSYARNYLAAPGAYWTIQNKECNGNAFAVSPSPLTLNDCQNYCNLMPKCWYAVWKANGQNCSLFTHDACPIVDSDRGERVYMRNGNNIDCDGKWRECDYDCNDVAFLQIKKAENGGKACDAEDGATKKCNAGDGFCGKDVNAPAPVTTQPVDDGPIDTLAKLLAWCDGSKANCDTCRGSYDGSSCSPKMKAVAKCRKFKGNAVCDRIVGCRSKTNAKGKTKCKGKKHGLA